MVTIRVLLVVLVGLASAVSSATTNTSNTNSAIGMNLARNHYFQTGVPWVNALKMAQGWRETPGGSGSCTQNDQPYSGAVDVNGYPTEIGTRACIYARLFSTVYATAFWPLGSWVLRYDGSASFDVSGAASNLVAGVQRATFDVGTGNGGVNLEITSLNVSNPPNNIRLYPPGGVCAANASAPYDFEPWSFCSTSRCQGGSCNDAVSCGGAAPNCIDLEEAGESQEALFHPLWLSRMIEYRTIRFMDWLHTNHSSVVDYSDWRLPDYYSWNYNIAPGNVPLSAIAQLCNTLNAECYVNVPHAATDANIVEMVRFLRDNVAPPIPIYLEYSNEVWNGIFTQKQYAYQAGDALPDSEFDGTNCLTSSQSNCAHNFYGKRTFEMCALAQQVMDETGQGDQLVCVMARQFVGANTTTATSLDCSRWLTAPGGNCYTGSDIDMLAVAPYFGDANDCSEVSSVSALCSRMDADVAAEYCSSPGCFIPLQLSVLDARGLAWPIITYEGGSHQSDTSSQICVDSAATAGSCIQASYVNALDAWKNLFDVGGHRVRQFLQFDSMSRYVNGGNLFGARGAMEGSWPKESGLLNWKNTPGNECWWPGCELQVPEPNLVGSLAAGVGLLFGLARLRGRRRF